MFCFVLEILLLAVFLMAAQTEIVELLNVKMTSFCSHSAFHAAERAIHRLRTRDLREGQRNGQNWHTQMD